MLTEGRTRVGKGTLYLLIANVAFCQTGKSKAARARKERGSTVRTKEAELDLYRRRETISSPGRALPSSTPSHSRNVRGGEGGKGARFFATD